MILYISRHFFIKYDNSDSIFTKQKSVPYRPALCGAIKLDTRHFIYHISGIGHSISGSEVVAGHARPKDRFYMPMPKFSYSKSLWDCLLMLKRSMKFAVERYYILFKHVESRRKRKVWDDGEARLRLLRWYILRYKCVAIAVEHAESNERLAIKMV
jgi:hypothetical protein